MKRSPPINTFGLFEKRFDGDNALMELARLRFQQSAMAPEFHAHIPEHLDWVMQYHPRRDSPAILHLPRHFNLVDADTQKRILAFAGRFAGRLHGMVLHDHAALADRPQDYIAAGHKLDFCLARIKHAPILFVEYPAGISPAVFAKFFSALADLKQISACIDIGHVGIREARATYAKSHAGADVCALKSQPDLLPPLMPAIETAVAAGAASVLDLIDRLTELKKPLHFHLHDGHPLSTASPFGVSDHLSFLVDIPLPFEHRGRRSVPAMFGPAGLKTLVRRAIDRNGSHPQSFTLEIHPTGDRLPLGDAAPLFTHWTDKGNAERMNHWLSLLSQNHDLLRDAINPN